MGNDATIMFTDSDDGSIPSYEREKISLLLAHHNATNPSKGCFRVHPECIGSPDNPVPDTGQLPPLQASLEYCKTNKQVLGIAIYNGGHHYPIFIDFRGEKPKVYSMESSRHIPDERNPKLLVQQADIEKLCKTLGLKDFDFIPQPPTTQIDGNGCGPYTVRTLTHMSGLEDQDINTVLKRLESYRDAPADDFTATSKKNIQIHTDKSNGFEWNAFVEEARKEHTTILTNYPTQEVQEHLEAQQPMQHKENATGMIR
jgi:hypothetical protein